MRVLFERLVVEIEVGTHGVLRPRPNAAWRWEPATREGTVHRELGKLADATPERIAAFASTHGLLRRVGGRLAALGPTESRRLLLPAGQRMADDIAAARDTLETDPGGSSHQEVRDLLAFAAVMDELPGAVHHALALASNGATPAAVEAAIGDALPDPADFFATLGARLAAYLEGTKPIPADRTRLRRGVDELDWVATLLGGMDDAPEWVNHLGGPHWRMASLVGNLPEAMLDPRLINERNAADVPTIEALAHETVDDWRHVADEFARWSAAAHLVRRVNRGAVLAPADKNSLAELYRALADFDAPAALTPGELGERVRPLLRAECETLLVDAGVWPIRRGSVVGLYGRALVALWTELTDERPLLACSTPGCAGTFEPSRNRLYCDACQAARRQEDVRSSRARMLTNLIAAPGDDK